MKNLIYISLIALILSSIACSDPTSDEGESLEPFWEQTNLKGNISHNRIVGSLAINSDGDIFAGDAHSRGGVFRSTDNGDSWTSNLTIINPSALAINSMGHIFAGGPGGLYRSKDNGVSWTDLSNAILHTHVFTFGIDFNGVIFAGTSGIGNGPVFRSMDNGDSWTLTNNGLMDRPVFSLAINSDNEVFAATNAGLFRSSDMGESWTEVMSGSFWKLKINSDGDIFASTGSSLDGILRSTDNGDSWTAVGPADADVHAIEINTFGHIFAGSVCRVFSGCEEDGGHGRFYRSKNNGDSWTLISSNWAANSVFALAINSDGYIFAGTDIGVFRSSESSILDGE